MSKMKMDRKPPLPKSPLRLRSRRLLQPNSAALQSALTTPGPLRKLANSSRVWAGPGSELQSALTTAGPLTKSANLKGVWAGPGSELRPDYLSMSCEYRTLAKVVGTEIANPGAASAMDLTSNSCTTEGIAPLFERGRFYDQYSARRNERLRRKRSCAGEETPMETTKKSTAYDLGVTAGPTKRRADSKKLESLRKSVCTAYSVSAGERNEAAMATPRYSLRSSTKGGKENNKPIPVAISSTAVKYRVGSERKVTTRRSKNI